MLNRNIIFMTLLASCATGNEGNTNGGNIKMKMAVQFTKEGSAYSISEVTSPIDLKGVVANVMLVNDTKAEIEFPCEFLKEQGVWVIYNMDGVDPYSVGTAPASNSSRSTITSISPGQSCTVSSEIDWETIDNMLKESPSGRGTVSIEYSIPEDEAFGAISGSSEVVTISVR